MSEYADRYEHPLPVLEVDADSLIIETKDRHEGKLTIKNAGDGTLNGCILSRCPGLTFEPAQWEGNREIAYTFNAQAAGLRIGESIEARFYVTSNGGEKEIPVTAKLTKMSISTAEGHTIANIRDFYDYACTHPTQARRMFTDSEFYMLLLASGYQYMEVYESLHKDANRERAMDNFFVLSGLKSRTRLEIMTHHLEFAQKPDDREILHGQFKVRKTDHGYVEAPIILQGESTWLALSTGKLSAADFDESYTATVNFTIDPAKISNAYAREQIIIGTEAASDGLNIIEIVYRQSPPFLLRLNRDAYRYEDKGVIEVINNTGMEMKVDVFCPESYIKFTARSFPVGAYGEIPFEVKLSAFLKTQLFFRKLPYMQTAIEIKAAVPGMAQKKNLPIVVGEW